MRLEESVGDVARIREASGCTHRAGFNCLSLMSTPFLVSVYQIRTNMKGKNLIQCLRLLKNATSPNAIFDVGRAQATRPMSVLLPTSRLQGTPAISDGEGKMSDGFRWCSPKAMNIFRRRFRGSRVLHLQTAFLGFGTNPTPPENDQTGLARPAAPGPWLARSRVGRQWSRPGEVMQKRFWRRYIYLWHLGSAFF